MKFASKLTVGTELDVDTLVEAKSDEIQRLLHSALFFARHFFSSFFSAIDRLSSLKPLPTYFITPSTSTQSHKLFFFFFLIFSTMNLKLSSNFFLLLFSFYLCLCLVLATKKMKKKIKGNKNGKKKDYKFFSYLIIHENFRGKQIRNLFFISYFIMI